MKTSNIIIIILLVCVTVFSFTYNWLLKEQFLAGNFTPNRFDPDKFNVQREFPPFQHVVIDGVLKGNNRNVEDIAIPWFVNSNGNHQTGAMKYPSAWHNMIHTGVHNDTLFISLKKDQVSETIDRQLLRWPSEIELTVPPIHSFIMINGKGYFEGENITNPVKLIGIDHASIAVNSTHLPALETILRDSSTIKFEDHNQINKLDYSLYNNAFLSISDQTDIEQLHPVYVDSLSRISITASAKELYQQIAKVAGDSNE